MTAGLDSKPLCPKDVENSWTWNRRGRMSPRILPKFYAVSHGSLGEEHALDPI